MPFQLDTSLYNTGGGPRAPINPFGMLSDILDIRQRQAQLQQQRAGSDLLNTQRQLAIDKARHEQAQSQALVQLFQTNPNAGYEDLIKIGIDPDDAMKIADANDKMHGKRETDAKNGMAAGAAGVLALPETLRPHAWGGYLDQGVQNKWLTPEQQRVDSVYTPELAQSYIDKALTPEQYAAVQVSRQNAKTTAATEERQGKLADLQQPGVEADVRTKVRTDLVQRLQGAPNLASYTQTYNSIDPKFLDGVPTPDQFAKNPKSTAAQLTRIGTTPENWLQHLDAVAARAQADDHFNRTETRLKNQEVTVTKHDAQAATRTRANDRQRLEEEKSRRVVSDNPMSDAEYNDRLMQIEENYREELHLPPDPKMAQDRKDAALQALNDDIARRAASRTVNGQVVPGKGMPASEVQARQLAIQNRYRSAFGQGPLAKLGPGWGWPDNNAQSTTPQASATPGTLSNLVPPSAAAPQPGAAGTVGALVRPQPVPQSALAPPPGSPASQNPNVAGEATQLRMEIQRINQQLLAPGPRDVGALKRELAAKVARYDALMTTR